MVDLAELGERICVAGPSNSGKSTLAEAVGLARGLPVVHLDRLRHLPNTDYELRPDAEFVALHDEAIASPRWIVDGNYSVCLPQRLERATGFILLDVPPVAALARYLRRCWVEPDRCGGLEGGRDSVKWAMVRHILVVNPRNRERFERTFEGLGIPKVRLASTRELNEFYRSAGLERPS